MRELLPLFTGIGVFVVLWGSLRAVAWVARTFADWRASERLEHWRCPHDGRR